MALSQADKATIKDLREAGYSAKEALEAVTAMHAAPEAAAGGKPVVTFETAPTRTVIGQQLDAELQSILENCSDGFRNGGQERSGKAYSPTWPRLIDMAQHGDVEGLFSYASRSARNGKYPAHARFARILAQRVLNGQSVPPAQVSKRVGRPKGSKNKAK